MASLNSDTSYPAYTYPEPGTKASKLQAFSSLSWAEWKEVLYKTLDEYEMKLNENKYVFYAKQKYLGNKYPITYILFGVFLSSIILTLYMLSGIRALSSVVGVVVPFYMSLKALNINGNTNEMNKTENMLWLSYWIIYGMFTLFESISHILLFWTGNMYEICKMAFFLYLYHPNTKGALFLYRQCLQPFVVQFINYEHALLHNIHILQKNVSINEDDILNHHNNNNYHHDDHLDTNATKNYTINTNTSANTSKINNYNTSSSIGTAPIVQTAPIIENTQPIITSAPLNPNINNIYVQ